MVVTINFNRFILYFYSSFLYWLIRKSIISRNTNLSLGKHDWIGWFNSKQLLTYLKYNHNKTKDKKKSWRSNFIIMWIICFPPTHLNSIIKRICIGFQIILSCSYNVWSEACSREAINDNIVNCNNNNKIYTRKRLISWFDYCFGNVIVRSSVWSFVLWCICVLIHEI